MTQRPMTARDVGLLNDLPGAAVADDRRYLRATLGWTLVLYGVLASALAGLLSPAWLLLAVPLVYVRLSLALHELMHLRAAAQVPAFHRLAMILDTPFGLGYREHRVVHLRHHRSSAGPDDPELYQIAGPHARALLGALLVPERSMLHWLRRHGMSRSLRRESTCRAAVFFAVAAIDPAVFAVYWLTLRASIAAAGFVFHHLLHQREGRLGTFTLPATPVLLALGRHLFGEEPMLILQRHRAHHLWPALRVRDLPDLPPGFELPPGPPDAALRALATQASREGIAR
jgi:fatty acid desaturase